MTRSISTRNNRLDWRTNAGLGPPPPPPPPPPTARIRVAAISGQTTEGDDIDFRITRDADVTTVCSVAWIAFSSGDPGDLTGVKSGTAEFAVSATVVDITIATIDRAGDQSNRLVTMTIYEPLNATVFPGQGASTVTLLDRAPTPPPGTELEVGPVSGDTNEGTSIVYRVTRSGDVTATSSCAWTVVSASGAADFTTDPANPSGTATFAIGALTANITVPTVNRSNTQGRRAATITISSPVGATLKTGGTTAVINIIDVVPAVLARLRVAATSGDTEEGTAIVYTITRDLTLGTACSCAWACTTPATASDLGTPRTGTASFAANVTDIAITVPTIDRATMDGRRNATMTISTPSANATLLAGSTAAVVVITDGAAAGNTLRVNALDEVVNEGSDVHFATVRSGDLNAVGVGTDYAVASSDPADITASNKTGTKTFSGATQETTKAITVATVARGAGTRADRTVTATLTNPTGGATFATGGTTDTITLHQPSAPPPTNFPSGLPWRSGMTIGGYDNRLFWDGMNASNSMARWRNRRFDSVLLYNASHGERNPESTAAAQWTRLVNDYNNGANSPIKKALQLGMQPYFSSSLLPAQEGGRFDLIWKGDRDNYLIAIADKLATLLNPMPSNTPAVICCPGQENTGKYPWSVRRAYDHDLTAIDYVKAFKRWARIMDVRINTGGRSRSKNNPAIRNARMYFSFNAMNNWVDFRLQKSTPDEYNPNRTNITYANSADRYLDGFDLQTYQPCDYWTLDRYDHTNPALSDSSELANFMGTYAINDTFSNMKGFRNVAKYAEANRWGPMSFGIQEWFPAVERTPDDGPPDPRWYKNYNHYIRAFWAEFKVLRTRQYNPSGDTPFNECGFNQTTNLLCHDLWPEVASGDEGATYGNLLVPSAEYRRLWTPGNGEGQLP